ncbi:MAG TPA: ABC transporter ATP-binding protein [Gemmataceae bacterium]|nr:ABC transporter ATP-binding protein [Gemmataceae bacterium]
MAAPVLDIQRLRKNYGSTTALDGVSFAVAEGEIFGLLGPNGAGKTTLLSIVSCLLEPSGGEVHIDGRLARSGDKSIRRLIGIVPQELAIYGELTARENLQFFGALYGMPKSVLRQRVEDVLRAVGLADRGDSRVETFSGGMKRRLNLGAGLVHGPRLLLLDEPTTGVDPQSRNHVFQEVRRINAAGVTVVYTSHYMEEVQTLCSRIGIVDHGRLIALGTLPELLRTLTGLIRFRVPEVTNGLRRRVAELPQAKLVERDCQTLELECRDVKATLLRVLGVLNEFQLELVSVETEEPNLERVFLHLTGRGLRD